MFLFDSYLIPKKRVRDCAPHKLVNSADSAEFEFNDIVATADQILPNRQNFKVLGYGYDPSVLLCQEKGHYKIIKIVGNLWRNEW